MRNLIKHYDIATTISSEDTQSLFINNYCQALRCKSLSLWVSLRFARLVQFFPAWLRYCSVRSKLWMLRQGCAKEPGQRIYMTSDLAHVGRRPSMILHLGPCFLFDIRVPSTGDPQNGSFFMDDRIEKHLGYPHFRKPPLLEKTINTWFILWLYIYIYISK